MPPIIMISLRENSEIIYDLLFNFYHTHFRKLNNYKELNISLKLMMLSITKISNTKQNDEPG